MGAGKEKRNGYNNHMNIQPFLKTPTRTASALAHPNIAFIKYWGNRDDAMRLPLTGSLSMNLEGLETHTKVTFDVVMNADRFVLNGQMQEGAGLARVSSFLDHLRGMIGQQVYALVESSNNFPAGAGIASSASAFAALAMAGSAALGLDLSESQLSRLARLGSGSASRSIPTGFVEWHAGEDDQNSYAESFAEPEHWDLTDMVVIIEEGHKKTGSTAGHTLAHSSPLNALRVEGVPERMARCKAAILARDFEAFAETTELDSNWMHAVMRTSTPALHYWTPVTEHVLWQVLHWRKQGHALCTTVDAGPNVHVLGLASELDFALPALKALPGVKDVIVAKPGGGARVLD